MIGLYLTLAAVTAAPAPPSPDQVIIYSDNDRARAVQDKIGWSDSVTVGDTVYISGVIAGTLPGDSGMEDAYVRAFDQLTKILDRAGASWSDVVEIRSFHTDPVAQIETMAAVKRRYRAAPDPAWTAVGTSALLAPNGLTEIALVAHKSERK